MRFIVIIICLVGFINCIYATPVNINNINKMSEGTFKKTITGKYVQYDRNGKKIGTYKIVNGRCYKVK